MGPGVWSEVSVLIGAEHVRPQTLPLTKEHEFLLSSGVDPYRTSDLCLTRAGPALIVSDLMCLHSSGVQALHKHGPGVWV
jgi:hypothetical protein